MAYQSYLDLLKQKVSDFASPVMDPHVQALQKPGGIIETSPTNYDYHMKGTADFANRVSNRLKQTGHPIASGIFDYAAPAGALVTSPIYDAIQAYQRMESGSGISGFWDAYKAELPGTLGRFVGASAPMYERLQGWKDTLGTYGKASAGEYMHDPRTRFKQQQLMNRRKQDMQQRIRQGEALEAAKQKVTTGGPPGGGDPGMTYTAPVTTAKGPPSIISRPKPKPYVSPARPHSADPPSGGGGAVSTGAGRNPWGRADGGLIDFYRYGGFSG